MLSGPAIERIEQSPIEQLVVTNTIPLDGGEGEVQEDPGAVGGETARPGDPQHPRGEFGLEAVRLARRGRPALRQVERWKRYSTRSERDTYGKNEARRTRRSGKVPAVFYGGRVAEDGRPVAAPIAVDPKALMQILHSESGANTLITFRLPASRRRG